MMIVIGLRCRVQSTTLFDPYIAGYSILNYIAPTLADRLGREATNRLSQAEKVHTFLGGDCLSPGRFGPIDKLERSAASFYGDARFQSGSGREDGVSQPDVEIVDESEDGDERTAVSFPFDRMTVQRFRQTFPRARWSDRRRAWIVPGKTARRRIGRWLAMEEARADPFAEAKGRDAYAFEPILSPYLMVDKDGFRIRTPYSRKLVEEIRQVPFARWDGDHKTWRVPFASYDDLLDHWQAIEAEAQRCEPEERRKRAAARKGTEEEKRARRRSAERRRRRIPLPADDLPPTERPVATAAYGIIIVSDVTGEVAEGEGIADLYPDMAGNHIWGLWRVPTLDELVHTRPSRAEPRDEERQRGWWWLPTLEELREARRAARSRERKAAAR